MFAKPDNRSETDRLIATGQAKISFSQLGEDGILWHYFNKKNGFYVDVGCFDPYRYSNTASLYHLCGWRGINIDANISSIEKFERERPRDINLATAVGLEAGRKTLAVFNDGAVNSLDPAMAASKRRKFGEPRSIEVDVLPLSAILERHLPPGVSIDLLDIDAEGWDLDVLRSNDWERFRPHVVAVEAHKFDLADPHANPTFQYLTGVGYSLRSHAVVTSIFVSNR